MPLLTALALAATPLAATPLVCDASWHDAARNRDMPVRIRMPSGTGKAGVILFSHGLGGSVDAGTLWADAWAQSGFIVIHLQHPGSDRGIGLRGLRGAMSAQQLIARIDDVRFAIDTLETHPKAGACDLDRADTTRIGMSGHSFGAHTTQAVAGQSFPGVGARGLDKRVRAAIAFSPAPRMQGDQSDADAFGGIAIPFYSLTGSEDAVPGLTAVTPADRIRPFQAMPAGGKYLLWLDGANHAAFGGQDRMRTRGSAPDAHVRPIILRSTTAFWQWTLNHDPSAKAQLDATAHALDPKDRFERK
jgi:predicted dienelactone hydrolase